MPKIIVFTGAGLSADSGVPTFRDADGLWEGHKIAEVCDFLTWRKNRTKVFEFYNARRTSLGSVQPNAAHRMIAGWERDYETVILTQNVDDLLERAGCRSVVHLHGELTKMRCLAMVGSADDEHSYEPCGHVWDVGYAAWGLDQPCPKCGDTGDTKPKVVFFNEMAPKYYDLEQVMNAITDEDIVVVIGTSGQVIDITTIMTMVPGYKILNNLQATDVMDDEVYDRSFYMRASEAAPEIDALVRSRMEAAPEREDRS